MTAKWGAVFLCGMLVLVLNHGIQAAVPKVGAGAPNFSLPDQHGKSVELASLKGKYVVLEWFNAECPFVHKHYASGNMQKLQKAFGEKGVVWLTINSSAEGKQGHLTQDKATQLQKEMNLASAGILLDGEGKVGKQYGAKTTPHMFVIDPKGKIIYAGAIDDKASTSTKSLEGANNYVAAALDEAMAGKSVTVSSTEPYGCSVKY